MNHYEHYANSWYRQLDEEIMWLIGTKLQGYVFGLGLKVFNVAPY